MRFFLLPLIGIGLMLSSCNQQRTQAERDLLANPLYAERYAEDLVEVITSMQINKDPLVEDESMNAQLEDIKKKWLEVARKSKEDQRSGLLGNLIEMEEYLEGEVLLLGDTLYFSPLFLTEPGPSLHVYLSPSIDPRDVEFPDEGSLDLGRLSSVFGTQEYTLELPETDSEIIYRTVVLWDTTLNRLFGFAQVN